MWRAEIRHYYVPMSVSFPTLFTRTQLQKLYCQFFHSFAENLYNIIRRSRQEDITIEKKKTLEDLTLRFEPSQKIRRGPTRFRVSLGA